MRKTFLISALLLTATQVAAQTYLQQSPGPGNPGDIDEWRKGEQRGELKPSPGTPNPLTAAEKAALVAYLRVL